MAVTDRFLLDVANRRALSADLTRAILTVERGGSMEEIPSVTVTVNDPRDVLMESRVLLRPAQRPLGTPDAFALRPIDVLMDGVWYRLRKAARSGDTVALTLLHRGAIYMGQHNTPLSASRADVTRALFIRRQVLEIARKRGAGHRLAFWAPEVRTVMPTAKADTSSRSEEGRDPDATGKRANSGGRITVRGRVLNASQRRNAAVLINEGERKKAPIKAIIALLEAAIIEPADPRQGREGVPFGNPTGGHSSSVGILQLLATHLNGSASTNGGRRDVKKVGDLFLTAGFTGRGGAIELARKNPGWSPGRIAQAVQGSAFPDRYETVRRDAERVYAALSDTAKDVARESGTYAKPYRFQRPRGEDAWTNTGNLAEEVGRRRFITYPARGSDLFVYSDDVSLLGLRAQARLDLDAGYVLSRPEYDLDYGKTVRSIRVTLKGDAFAADLVWGLPVLVDNAGVEHGRWLVWDVRETDGAAAFDVELRQPQAATLEPAAERVQRADSSDSGPDSVGEGVDAVYLRADAIGDRNYPYVWGGGHAVAGRPDRGTGRDPGTGYDCSGYVAACLHAGGMLPGAWARGVPASGTFASSYGEAGPGDRMTVWANGQHVFIEFKLKSRRGKYADTSRQAGGPSGPHLRRGNRSTAGFTARHWPGS